MRVNTQVPSSRHTYSSVLSPLDCVWAAIAPYMAFALRDAPLLADPARIDAIVLFSIVAFFAALITMAVFRLGEGLARYFSIADLLPLAQASIGATALTGTALFAVTRLADVPRSILPLHAILLAGGWIGWRLVARLIARRKAEASNAIAAQGGDATGQAIVIGVNTTAWLLLKMLEERAAAPIRIAGFLESRPKFIGRSVAGYPVIGQPQMLDEIVQEYAVHGVTIDRVIVAVPRTQLKPADSAAIKVAQDRRKIAVQFVDDLLGVGQLSRSPGADVIPMPLGPKPDAQSLRTAVPPRGRYWAAKRAVDVLVALCLSLALLPVAALTMLVVLVAIGAPAMFWQQRVGQGGRDFMIFKFRTLKAPFDRSGRPREESARLGAVGRWLRATRLDELPQLVNVLRGDMSIIGPRPLLPIDLPKDDVSRLAVRPGLTGWAQVNGGKQIDAETKNLLDRWYIDNASLALDLQVVWLTVATVVRGEKIGTAEIEQARKRYASSESPEPVGRREAMAGARRH